MATKAELYYQVYSKGEMIDGGDWEVDITGVEEQAYRRARRLRLPYDDIDELFEVRYQAEHEICEMLDEEHDLDIHASEDNEKMDPDELNELVHGGDSRAIAFFGLESLQESELMQWDAHRLSYAEVPTTEEFFGTKSDRYIDELEWLEQGYTVYVDFQCHEDLTTFEATITLTELMVNAHGDYNEVREFIKWGEDYYIGREDEEDDSLEKLAMEIAEVLYLEDFCVSDNNEN